MKNITELFKTLHEPKKGLVIYETPGDDDREMYIEMYDMDHRGRMINAHPLDMEETEKLMKALQTRGERRRAFLQPTGVIDRKVLYLNGEEAGFAIWYTSPKKVQLHFIEELEIPCGVASVPALVWKASRTNLSIFALSINSRPVDQTALYHAPFFNIGERGAVCMGTVTTDIAEDCSLEEFMQQWEEYFYNSYFSHLLQQRSPIEGNIIQFWQKHMEGTASFPVGVLTKNGLHLKDILK